MAYATLPHPYLRHHHFMQDPPYFRGLWVIDVPTGWWVALQKGFPLSFLKVVGCRACVPRSWGCSEAFFQSKRRKMERTLPCKQQIQSTA